MEKAKNTASGSRAAAAAAPAPAESKSTGGDYSFPSCAAEPDQRLALPGKCPSEASPPGLAAQAGAGTAGGSGPGRSPPPAAAALRAPEGGGGARGRRRHGRRRGRLHHIGGRGARAPPTRAPASRVPLRAPDPTLRSRTSPPAPDPVLCVRDSHPLAPARASRTPAPPRPARA
ncbi:uncharacterized protein LOC122911106 [Neovison vison]|uniref:uncharacterized protein LOC122911106 n=1 Tax=Neovison vison TaxID=452646 RepID=UPI001CF05F27|nr:uncharacterized protein LOC122911106 [Neogale vison]